MWWMLVLGAWYFGCFLQVARIAFRATSSQGAADWVLLLGKRSPRGNLHPHLQSRISRAQKIIDARSGLGWVLSGGGRGGEPTEASLAKDRLRFSEICRVEMEESSMSTWENFLLTKELLIARGQSPACVAVVSNRYHLARCKAIADAVGIPVVLCAAEDRMDASLESMVLLTRETFYLMIMNVKILAWHITRFPRA